MTQGADRTGRWVRAAWPALGGLWGAWVGLRGLFRLAYNPDTFASMLAGGFFVLYALIGLLAGAACGWLVGRLVESGMRRIGAGLVVALAVASVVNLVVLWQASRAVGRIYPGLRAERGAPPVVRSKATPAARGCAVPPAADDPTSRKSWEEECR